MSRPLRIEFAGALYHVTSRGDRREAIYRSDDDRQLHLGVIGHALARFAAQAWAYCLMGNHYHLVVQTSQPNLSRLMRQINGVYTQAFNRRHGLVGHLFQGRFKAILVDGDAYLLTLCRYVERNPVAAGLVRHAGDWPWSSYRAHVGAAAAPAWLNTDALYAQLLGRSACSSADRRTAARRYADQVDDAEAKAAAGAEHGDAGLWPSTLRQQIFMGSDEFVQRMQQQMAAGQLQQTDIPRAQRRKPTEERHHLKAGLGPGGERNSAILHAHREQGMTMTAIARELGLSVARVSRLIAREEAKGKT
jgi:putative transposase